MSTYYNTVSDIKENGKPVNYCGSNYNLIRFKNRLVAVSSNGLFERAVDVTEKNEYEYFYQQYYSGMWLNWDLYDYVPEETQ